MTKTKPHLLIDGDMLVYTIGYASESKGSFVDGAKFHQGDLDLCKRLIRKQIKHFLTLFNTDHYSLIVSGSGNYRTEFFPNYKANRVTLVKPICYNGIRQWFKSLPETILVDGEEADDYIAAACTHPETGHQVIAITADKDFYTVPGKIYSITAKRLFYPTIGQSFSFLFFQALNGDRVDGYFGVKWLGASKCQRLLTACHHKTIRQTYLFIKQQVLKRGKTAQDKKEIWNDFRTCLGLASLRWTGEVGNRGIGLRRVFKHRRLTFEYFLPYYDVNHNKKYGQEIHNVESLY